MSQNSLKIFEYIEQLDCFVVRQEYRELAEHLGLAEWNPVVWIGRLFALDNDYGEHWFDNWDLREEKQKDAERLGMEYEELMIVDPSRFKNDDDGPCHTPEVRKIFWTDVLRSFELSYELLFKQARIENSKNKESFSEEYLDDLENRIIEVQSKIERGLE